MARIALKVDVDTLRGTREGVPRLLASLERARVRATFLFSLGPDHTGWALRRAFRPGFFSKVSRTSVVAHYGVRTLLYGVLLPAPDIGRVAAGPMRAARDAGHECGIHTWDHVVWQDGVRHRDAAWTARHMSRAHERYVEIFGAPPATHGAAGWQMNAAAFRQLDAWGLTHASDGRGDGAYVPVAGGVACRHVQWPTTLPTLDELIGLDGITADNVADRLLARTADTAANQVYTLHAELEGGLLGGAFDALLAGWRAQGHALVALDTLQAGLTPDAIAALPRLPIAWGSVPGRSGRLIVQRPVGADGAASG